MVGWLIAVVAAVAFLLYFIGETEPRRRLRDVGFYLLAIDMVVVGLVVAGIVGR